MRRLARYMRTHDLTQQRLAELVGVSQPTVSLWLSGGKLPRARNLQRLMAITGLSMDELLSDADASPATTSQCDNFCHPKMLGETKR